MLTFEQIKELVDLVSGHGLSGFELERSGFRLRIDGRAAAATAVETQTSQAPVPSARPRAAVSPEPLAAAPEVSTAVTASAVPSDAHILNSPIVGTFYSASSPDAAPFAAIGDRVKKGQVVCIVEAMKLMNEIESDADGVVVAIYPKNAQPVEFGEPLFAIRQD